MGPCGPMMARFVEYTIDTWTSAKLRTHDFRCGEGGREGESSRNFLGRLFYLYHVACFYYICGMFIRCIAICGDIWVYIYFFFF